MSETMKQLGIDRMPADKRIELALAIWESLGEDTPRGQMSPEFVAELKRRDAEMDADPECEMSWNEIRARIEADL